jgi:hypothetical protein
MKTSMFAGLATVAVAGALFGSSPQAYAQGEALSAHVTAAHVATAPGIYQDHRRHRRHHHRHHHHRHHHQSQQQQQQQQQQQCGFGGCSSSSSSSSSSGESGD